MCWLWGEVLLCETVLNCYIRLYICQVSCFTRRSHILPHLGTLFPWFILSLPFLSLLLNLFFFFHQICKLDGQTLGLHHLSQHCCLTRGNSEFFSNWLPLLKCTCHLLLIQSRQLFFSSLTTFPHQHSSPTYCTFIHGRQ